MFIILMFVAPLLVWAFAAAMWSKHVNAETCIQRQQELADKEPEFLREYVRK